MNAIMFIVSCIFFFGLAYLCSKFLRRNDVTFEEKMMNLAPLLNAKFNGISLTFSYQELLVEFSVIDRVISKLMSVPGYVSVKLNENSQLPETVFGNYSKKNNSGLDYQLFEKIFSQGFDEVLISYDGIEVRMYAVAFITDSTKDWKDIVEKILPILSELNVKLKL